MFELGKHKARLSFEKKRTYLQAERNNESVLRGKVLTES